METPPRAHGTVHSGIDYTQPRAVPTDRDLKRAADVLNAGNKVTMLVGAGALHATDEVLEVADLDQPAHPPRPSLIGLDRNGDRLPRNRDRNQFGTVIGLTPES